VSELSNILRKDISIALLLPLGLTAKQAVIASLFLVMYLPCVATFAVATREAGWRAMARLMAVTLGWAVAVGWVINMLWR